MMIGCSAHGGFAQNQRDRIEWQMRMLTNAQGAYTYHTKLINGGSTDYPRIDQNLALIGSITSEFKSTCDREKISGGRYSTGNYLDCLNGFSAAASLLADATVKTGDYYAKNGKKEEAKRLYRSVVTDFTGTKYAGYVKQAEFGLVDLEKQK